MRPEAVCLEELARLVGGRVEGDPRREVRDVAPLETAGPSDLSFLTNVRYRAAAEATRAGAVLVGTPGALPGRDLLVAPEPYLALAKVLDLFHPAARPEPGVSADARIAASARIGRDVSVAAFAVVEDGARVGDRTILGAGCVVGAAAVIGDDTWIHPRVVLYPGTEVGARCIVHAGAVLGADGFGFATSRGVHTKVPQLGRVVVEDDVEIGANTAIDRGALGETRIGRGTKIDDLVMIGHGTSIGPGGMIAGQAGIAGSTKLGGHVTLAGQVGVGGHLRVGDRVVAAAKSAILADVEDGAIVAGIPATDLKAWRRAQAIYKSLPELRAEVRALRALLAERASAREGGNA